MDVGGVVFAALIIVLAIPFVIKVRRGPHGPEKTLETVGLVAAVLVGVVNLFKALGYLPEGPLYWTLNIALVVLFWAMFYQVHQRRKGRTL